MKKIIIISTYFNNPHFIEYQYQAFNRYIEGGFVFAVVDDSAPDTTSLYSGRPATLEIQEECKKYNGIHYIRTPQEVHKNISEGGLVPDGLLASHPTERHRANLHWIFKNYKQLGFNEYKILMLVESDLFPKKIINIKRYMEDCDIVGTFRDGILDKTWLTFQLLIVNLEKVKNLENINVGGYAGSDTGFYSHLFLQDNTDCKVKYLCKFNDISFQVDFLAKESCTPFEAEFIHYRGGTNWDCQNIDYYKEKTNRMFKKYMPEFYIEQEKVNKDLNSRDGEHTFKAGE